ncbi:Inner centromere protein A [Eufriesea mexicana]|uniref:Inner centromere protein A n=1 Tax=Eufriesea mexicana TaxID=516756 RepID=A0A310SES7_9HYME|nr:PREDICTED: inner centromere protein-like [Eufriesea mexicana]OAD55998.1 Inner centromere protein A [Eufriesea mexicana]
MGTRSKDRIKAMIATDILNIYNHSNQVKKSINDNLQDTLDYFHSLIAQIRQSTSGPLITKTPKVLKKKVIQRIETIPENDIINTDDATVNSFVIHDKTENKDIQNENECSTIGRTKRAASRKAANNIKKLQSMSLSSKLRRPSNSSEDVNTNKKRGSRTKRKMSPKSSSDEDTTQGHRKHSKIEERVFNETISKKATDINKQQSENYSSIIEDTIQQEKIESSKSSMTTRNSRKRTFSQSENAKSKKSNIIDDTVIAPIGNDIEEPSMYEDAIGKPTPIMNSTMNFNSTFTMQKIMNATVVLEPLPAMALNETVTINKNSTNSIRKSNGEKTFEVKTEVKSSKGSKYTSHSSVTLQDRMQQLKEAMANKEFDELFTEDESSPEVKKPKANIKKSEIRKQQKQVIKSASSSEDVILNTSAKPTLKEMNTVTGFQEGKSMYKTNALFSPYAKESVKKRVEAFEQAGMNSPKITVDIDVPIRITRTKTRARAAAQQEIPENTVIAEKTVAHKLARKSLAKAKKISLAKQNKNVDEHKENKLHSTQKANKVIPIEKVNCKQQQKTTPLGKTRTQLPMSVNRIPHTPSNQINVNHNKASSTTRTNIITSVESLIQAPKSVTKRNSLDKTDDKRRKLNDEDAKKKREETLRLMTEEKRRKRQEKELRNKLAREAKEKLDMEKRQKAEKEREEKARLAQQMQEKQREEMEKKRLAQLQRAQEKEEKRKQEEQQRLQRLQEQEEAERILAEQRRREQEAERRKELEVRAQHQAAAEAMKAKHNMLMTQAKYESKQHGPTTYILDSEPDDDESDDESSPKHVIPYWAQSHVRKAQLAIQRYIPERAVYKFFDTRKCTPDLTQLFQGIDRSRLKRTSSAIWKTPPRYSMMEIE